MKNTFQLSIIIVYLSFIPISDCSTGNIMTDELAGTPPKPAHTQTQLPPPENIQTNNATVIEEVVLLKKTSEPNTLITPNGEVEDDSTREVGAGDRKAKSGGPSKKSEVVPVKVPEADFSFVGNTRLVKNKKLG